MAFVIHLLLGAALVWAGVGVEKHAERKYRDGEQAGRAAMYRDICRDADARRTDVCAGGRYDEEGFGLAIR